MSTITPESFPDVDEVREGFMETIERHRVAILGGLAIAVFGTLGALAWSSLRQERVDELHTELHSITGSYQDGQTIFLPVRGGGDGTNPKVALEQATKLESLRERAKGTDVEPLVLFHLALRYQVAGEDDKALSLVSELESEFADSPVTQVRSFDSARASLVARIRDISLKRKEFGAKHLYEAPVRDETGFALVETDLGKLKIAFFKDRATQHVSKFTEMAKKGAFNGTKFYKVKPGQWVEAGGAEFTRDDDPRNDGEDHVEDALPPEDDATFGIRHNRGTITSVKMLSGDQGDRFAIVLRDDKRDFDAVRTPFGELLDESSREVADRLAAVITYAKDALYQGKSEANRHPDTPSPAHAVTIWRVSIWEEGALQEGHAWDTARVDSAEPEPAPEEDEEE